MQSPTASPQGIASLYMGNPGALQQRINKDQQAKPGLPPDLQKLMALNIVTNEQDAAKRQQALSALQSMAPAGAPPTVAQSVEEQAKQKLQAQQQQQMAAQQQQQGPQGLSPFLPPQGQGIDASDRVQFSAAEGGIVAFAGGDKVDDYETRADKLYRENRERAEKERAAKEKYEAELAAGPQFMEEDGNYYAAPLPADARRQQGPGLLQKLADYAGRNVERDPETGEVVRKSAPTVVSQVPAGGPELPRGIMGARSYPTEPQPAQQVISGKPSPLPAPAVAGLPVAAKPAGIRATAAAPQAPDDLKALLNNYNRKALTADSEAARAADQARYDKEVGRPDTTQMDRLMAELENRKAQLNAPAKGFDAFAEYMAQIANAGPQRTWYEAGAKGAAAQTALNKERQAQQFELTKQGVEIAQKKLDLDRTFNKERYVTGDAAVKRIDEAAKSAAKEIGGDIRHQETMANDIKKQLLANEGHLAAAKVTADARTANTDPATAAAVNAVKNDEVINALQKRLAEASKKYGSAGAAEVASIQAQIAARQDAIYKALKAKVPASTMGADSALFSAADAILSGKK